MINKKLIEVALPLDAINKASAREKSIRHGHPSTLHLWWARRPLAAARAVIFAQMVDDPSAHPELFPTEAAQEQERQRLFRLIEELVLWENTTNEAVLARAREEIWKSWRLTCQSQGVENKGMEAGSQEQGADMAASRSSLPTSDLFNPDKLPAFHDPFAGGGSLPLEAQRLGLEAYASDLNPVSVLINKAMIEIPPKFAGRSPINPKARKDTTLIARTWHGAQGLAEDVRYYGQWMRDEAEKRIGHLYPKIEVTAEMARERPDLKPLVGRQLTVIAWLWARTVKSPNPAFAHVDVPLASTFMLSTKAGKEAYVEPVVEHGGYRFMVRVGRPKDAEAAKRGTKSGSSGSSFLCLMSGTPMPFEYLRSEAKAGRMGARLMAVVAEGDRSRVYLSPSPNMEAIALSAQPQEVPETDLPKKALGFRIQEYGMTQWRDLFTPRQLVALTTFSDLVQEARERVRRDALAAGFDSPTQPSPAGGGLSDPFPAVQGSSNSSPQRGEVGRGELWRPTPLPQALLETARDLRKSMTNAEQLLWQCLRGKQLNGFRFRKQHPVERFVLDFYCASAKLAIELDGGQHNTDDGKTRDAERNAYLEKQGIRVVRFWNHEIFENLDGVLTRIWEVLHEGSPCRDPSPVSVELTPTQPSPAGGGLSDSPPARGRLTGSSVPVAGDGHCISDSSPQRGETGRGEDIPLHNGGTGATAYADAVGVYLAFAISKLADRGSSICTWFTERDSTRNTFARQSLPMTWDYAELNTLLDGTGSFIGAVVWTAESIEGVATGYGSIFGASDQLDAMSQSISTDKLVSTDPPYYDNIGYADLSDFFYVWLRRSLRPIFPDLFATLAVPKAEELVATPYRHGSKEKAEHFFLNGMTQAMHRLAEQAHPAFPVTIYYAFKQAESDGADGTTNTGWDTFLAAVIEAGLAISGTWPMRTELGNRMIGSGTNALASSIVLVCRKRPTDAPTTTRREFLNALKAELPQALIHLQRGNIAPVDLAQAAIGPGMAVYTRYTRVLDAEGKPLSVREALSLINQTLDEVLAEQEGDFDADTRWALTWFEQSGFAEGEYGVAEQLSKSKNTSVAGMVEAGILESKRGTVRLFRPDELPADWDPATDPRLTA